MSGERRPHRNGVRLDCPTRNRTCASCRVGTDWPRIVALDDALAALVPSLVVELNRAVAVGMAYGPAEALALVDALRDAPQLANYHLPTGVRADLLEKLGRHDEARAEFQRAAGMTRNARERALLERRAFASGTPRQ